MEKEFRAKTVEEAEALAAKEFGVPVEDIDFDILEQPRKTFFGGLKGEARVNAIYNPPAEPVHTEPEEELIVSEDVVFEETVGQAEETAEDVSEGAEETEDAEEGEQVLPADFDVNNSAKVRTAIDYLTAVLRELGLEKFTITPVIKEGGVVLDISGEKLGVVIGKRGETLDSLQYLAILASNRAGEDFCKISLDCNGYRDKRRDSLIALAKKTSAKVIKQGRKIALEPMNPYERRIIHSCVADIEGVSSRSTGTEPYRKVVIYADKPKFRDNRRRSGSGNGSSARNYRQSGGYSTSFEREYKRKAYEPDENANAGEFSRETMEDEKNATLYGKIDL